jgi:acetyl-CoA/propionyl-CoA carboxylase, biotin carboxylase, biotin carboxyl carrier protein
VDAGVAEGGVVGSAYDPMLAKVIVWAPTRDEALRGLHAALGETVLLGLDTNIGFLRALLADPDVRAGRLDTGLVGRRIDALTAVDVPPDVLPAAAVHALAELEPGGPVVDPFDVPGGWRVGAPAWTTWRMAVAGRDPLEVRARGRATDAVVEVRPPITLRAEAPGGEVESPPVRASGRLEGDRLVVTVDDVTRTYAVALDGDTLWLGRDGGTWAVHEQGPVDAVAAETTGAGGPVRSPMPGTVTLVEVADGQTVTAGDRLVVVEAMKMEHVLTAPVDGVVRDLRAKAGATVAKDAVLLSVDVEER